MRTETFSTHRREVPAELVLMRAPSINLYDRPKLWLGLADGVGSLERVGVTIRKAAGRATFRPPRAGAFGVISARQNEDVALRPLRGGR
jgi:hypothetical protein